MAAAATEASSPLLDLSFLTEEERVKIERVLRADAELKTRDRIRLGSVSGRESSLSETLLFL